MEIILLVNIDDVDLSYKTISNVHLVILENILFIVIFNNISFSLC